MPPSAPRCKLEHLSLSAYTLESISDPPIPRRRETGLLIILLMTKKKKENIGKQELKPRPFIIFAALEGISG